MRDASIAVLREIGVETGGSNVQFAVNPKNGKLVVIEMNPRVSRSSALASKATGFPIAKVAAKLAVGYSLDEIKNDITGGATPASFEPTIDYVITKIPRFTFEKFKGSDNILSSSMKSVGEAMGIGRSFAESLQKALRSLEMKVSGLDDMPIDAVDKKERQEIIKQQIKKAVPNRILLIAQAIREEISLAEIHAITFYDMWFLQQLEAIVMAENEVRAQGLPQNYEGLLALKKMGFADKRLAKLADVKEKDVEQLRQKLGVKPVYRRVDSCAAEFDSGTAYMYSCYE